MFCCTRSLGVGLDAPTRVRTHMRVRIHARAYVCRLLREAHADMRNADIRLSEVRFLPVAASASWCLHWRRRLRSHH